VFLAAGTSSSSTVPLSVFGQSTTWQVKVGSQVPDCLVGAPSDSKLAEGCQAHQAIAFLPNEIWVHQNDSITWTQATEENHTVTFVYEPQPTALGVGPYPAAQQRPSNAVGCSAYGGVTSASNSAYDPSGAKGLQCVNSGVLPSYGSTYTVSFPAQGNFKFTCLIHSSMNGIVHVLDPSACVLCIPKTPSSGFPSNVTLLLPGRLLNPGSSSLPHVADFNGIRRGWDLRDTQCRLHHSVEALFVAQSPH
jgi:plastocyanin